MGSAATCKTFCPTARNQEIEIISPIKPVALHEITLEPLDRHSELTLARGPRSDKQQNTGEKQAVEKEQTNTKSIDLEDPWASADGPTERPSVIEPVYSHNHIVVPFEIIRSKLQDEIILLLKKQLPKCPLLQDQAVWYLLPSGNYYSGEFTDGELGDQGTYLLSNGAVYSGKVVRGSPQGVGVLIQCEDAQRGGHVYKGQFSRGQAKGKGRFETEEIIAEGTWASGYMTHGKITTKKYSYHGELSYGKPSGDGTYKDVEKQVTYSGRFVQGLFDCNAICPVKSENKDDPRSCKTTYRCPEYTYEGPFKAGRRTGEGTMKYRRDGQQFTRHGVWLADQFQSK